MHTGKLVFAQVMEHLPLTTFRRCALAIVAFTRSSGSPVSINTCAWPSRSSLTVRVCATSKRVCARNPPTVTHGDPQPGGAQHPRQCQCHMRPAHLLLAGTEPHRHGSSALCHRTLWARSEGDALRSRCHHNRPVSVSVSPGHRFARPRRFTLFTVIPPDLTWTYPYGGFCIHTSACRTPISCIKPST